MGRRGDTAHLSLKMGDKKGGVSWWVLEVYFEEHPAREADPVATGLISSLNIIVPDVSIPPRKSTHRSCSPG